MSKSASVKPTVAVGAVIFVGGKVVLVRRAKPPLAGHWTLPGGSVEPGETLAEAAVREVAEETGLTVSAGGLVEIYEHVSRDATGALDYHYVIMDYLCHVVTGELVAGSDAAEVLAADADDLDRLGVGDATRRVIRRAEALAAAEPPRDALRLSPVVHD
jgi:mutator protein MutT